MAASECLCSSSRIFSTSSLSSALHSSVVATTPSAPSSSFLRGYLDALGKTGRNGLALEYAKTFAKKGWVDDVDGALLEARVYSSWKGHGKDAEKAYDSVVADHPSDFRGYLAQGVFYRTVGKPDAAENAFRKAKSLAPADTAGVVNQVIAASKSSK